MRPPHFHTLEVQRSGIRKAKLQNTRPQLRDINLLLPQSRSQRYLHTKHMNIPRSIIHDNLVVSTKLKM